MGLLDAIWVVSFGLAVASVVLMGVLILRRVFNSAVADRQALRRKDLEKQFLLALNGEPVLNGAALSEGDRVVLAQIAYDLSASIKGGILEDMEAVLAGLDVERTLLRAVTDRDPNIRNIAVNGLSLFNTRTAFDAIWQCLYDSDLNIRLLAARDIVDAPFDFDAQMFVETLELGTVVRSREVRPIVVALAGRDPHGVLRAIKRTDNPERRVFLIYGLGRSGSYEMLDDLVDFTFSDNVNERSESLRALSVLQHPAAAGAVRRALRDPAWEVRAQAAQAVGDIGLPEVQSTLELMLNDDMWWVRYRAAASLWRLGGAARDRLLAHAHDDGKIGLIAQLTIAEWEGKAA